MSKLLYTGSEWTTDTLYEIMAACEEIAVEDLGLDCFPNQIEIITVEQMLDAYSSVGMPLMYNHWSFGKSFLNNTHNYNKGRMGLAYELVINSDPCINYLMEENSVTTQALVIAHAAFGHNHFFKNNYLFQKWTQPDAIVDYLLFAKKYVAECELKYGQEAVEEILDACHAIQRQSVNKYKKPVKLNARKEREKQKQRAEYLQSQVNDLWSKTVPEAHKNHTDAPVMEPEENLLYFLEKNSPVLKDWERELCRIVRMISQYFYPQIQTKVLNEGFASFTHYHIMTKLHEQGRIDDGSYIEFLKLHTSVLYQPGYNSPHYGGINPYCLGFDILTDVKRMCTEPTAEDVDTFPDLVGTDWRAAIRDIAANYRDESGIRQFLSPNIVRDWGLFHLSHDQGDDKFVVRNIQNHRGFRNIRNKLAEQYEIGSMIPDIQIVDHNITSTRTLELVHQAHKGQLLDENSVYDVILHVQRLWGYNVTLETVYNGESLEFYEAELEID